MNIQARVALDKEAHPERFCPARRCLWRTDDPTNRAKPGDTPRRCPRHPEPVKITDYPRDEGNRETRFPTAQNPPTYGKGTP